MSLNIFWFLPTHGDGKYLGTSEGARAVDHGYLGQIAQAADRLGFGGVLIPPAAPARFLAGGCLADPAHPASEIPGRVAPGDHFAHRGGAPGGNAGSALGRSRAVQPGHRRRPGRAGRRRPAPVPRRTLRGLGRVHPHLASRAGRRNRRSQRQAPAGQRRQGALPADPAAAPAVVFRGHPTPRTSWPGSR